MPDITIDSAQVISPVIDTSITPITSTSQTTGLTTDLSQTTAQITSQIIGPKTTPKLKFKLRTTFVTPTPLKPKEPKIKPRFRPMGMILPDPQWREQYTLRYFAFIRDKDKRKLRWAAPDVWFGSGYVYESGTSLKIVREKKQKRPRGYGRPKKVFDKKVKKTKSVGLKDPLGFGL